MSNPTNFLFQLTKVNAADIINAPHDWRIIESGVTFARDGVTGIDGATETNNLDAFAGLALSMTRTQIEASQADGRPIFAYVNVAVTDPNRAYWEVDGVNWIDPKETDQGNLDLGKPTVDAPDWLNPAFGLAGNFGPIVDFTNEDWRRIVVDQIIAQLEAGYSGIFLDDVGRYDEIDLFSDGEAARLMMETVNWIVAEAKRIAAGRSDLANDFQLIINSDPYIASNFYFSITDPVSYGGQERLLTDPEAELVNTFMTNVDGLLTENVAELTSDPWQVGRNWFDGDLSGFDARLMQSTAVFLAIETGDTVQNIGNVFDALAPDVLAFLPIDQAYDIYMDIPQIGTAEGDILLGGDRPDALVGLQGDDYLSGGGDADLIYAGSGADLIDGGTHADVIFLSGTTYHTTGYVALNVSSDTQVGTQARINLEGLVRIEVVTDGGADADLVQLSDESDAFFLHDAYSGFHSSVALAQDYAGTESVARFANIEVVRGMGGDDIIDLTSPDYSLDGIAMSIDGGDGNDVIWGSDANENISGGNGNDTIFGGIGTDVLTGGEGADVFEFTRTSTGTSVIDFDIAEGDTLRFYNAGGAVFDASSVELSDRGILISYSDTASGTSHGISIDLVAGATGLTATLPEVLNALEIL